MEKFIGTKIIKARPQECKKDIHSSKKGDPGYLVEYEDGYQSWSPKDVFEKAYHKCKGMNFEQAIEAMKIGKRVARKGWNGEDIFIELQSPDKNSKMTSPYIYINTTGLKTNNSYALKCLVPWFASQMDMFVNDWKIVEGEIND